MDKKTLYVVVAAMAILHDGKRYEKGSKIELTEAEAENLSLYIKPDVDEQAAQRKAAEEQAEKARLAAEQVQKDAEEKDAKKSEKVAKQAEEKGKA